MDDNKLIWHELNDLSTVQMVPIKVNSTLGHFGGIFDVSKVVDLVINQFIVELHLDY